MALVVTTVPAEWPADTGSTPLIIGTPEEGETLTCIAGGATSFQWLRDGVPIVGATDDEYLVTGADAGKSLSCRAGFGSNLLTVPPGEEPPPATIIDLLDDGVWSWFTDPRAIYHSGERRQVYAGGVMSDGSIRVASRDLDTDETAVFTLHAQLEVDDHDNPSILVLPDGRLRVWYCKHSVIGGVLYTRVSTNPEDITAWGPVQQITNNVGIAPQGTSKGYAYPKPIMLSGEANRIYLFFRGANYSQAYLTSDDMGVTYSVARTMFSNGVQRPYFQVASDGIDTIHFTCTDGHPRNVLTNNIYHFTYRAGQLRKSDGTVIAPITTGTTPAGVTKVYDNALSGKAWGWNLIVDGDGTPHVVFATFLDNDTNHRYRYARWTGSAWTGAEIAAGGGSIHPLATPTGLPELDYSGGVAIDGDDPTVVYLSRPVSGQWEIEKWITDDQGATWALDRAITEGSTDKQFRPWVLTGRDVDVPQVIWLSAEDGEYTTFVDYRTTVKALTAGS